jgi:hypothetical protein
MVVAVVLVESAWRGARKRLPKVDRATETEAQFRRRRGNSAVPSSADLARWRKQRGAQRTQDSPEQEGHDDG